MSSSQVLVIGATGKQGGAVARLLLKKEWKVRALVRKPDAPAARELARLGAELVTGSLENGPGLERAVEGVSRVFALSTPNEGPEAEARQVEALCAALASRRIEHLVYSSGANVNRPTGLSRHAAKAGLEQRIQALGIPWTIVAPTSFMENMLAPPGLAALRQGRLAWTAPRFAASTPRSAGTPSSSGRASSPGTRC